MSIPPVEILGVGPARRVLKLEPRWSNGLRHRFALLSCGHEQLVFDEPDKARCISCFDGDPVVPMTSKEVSGWKRF